VDPVDPVDLEVLWDGKSYLQVGADRALFSFSAARLRNLILIGLSSFVNQCWAPAPDKPSSYLEVRQLRARSDQEFLPPANPGTWCSAWNKGSYLEVGGAGQLQG